MGTEEPEDRRDEGEPSESSVGTDDATADATEEADEYAPLADVDGRVVDLLAWILDTETRAKIYVYLLANPRATSEEVAQGTGLYPSTVREALAELHDEERVTRRKRESGGAGNNPYEYTAIPPSDLVGSVVDQVQRELNAVFTLGRGDRSTVDDVEPVRITVEDDEDDTVDGERTDDDGERTDDDGGLR